MGNLVPVGQVDSGDFIPVVLPGGWVHEVRLPGSPETPRLPVVSSAEERSNSLANRHADMVVPEDGAEYTLDTHVECLVVGVVGVDVVGGVVLLVLLLVVLW